MHKHVMRQKIKTIVKRGKAMRQKMAMIRIASRGLGFSQLDRGIESLEVSIEGVVNEAQRILESLC